MRALPAITIVFLIAASALHAQTPALLGGPMLDCSGLPCVDIVVATGKHLRMLVDTGNADSILDATVANNMGLSLTPVNGADGKPVPGYSRAVLTGVMLGEASLDKVALLVMDLSAYIKRDRIPASDGSLSYTAFKNRLLQLDYKNKTVRISGPLTETVPCPTFCGDVTHPTFGKDGPPIVVSTGFAINGRPLTVQIDTLFSGTMLVYPPAVAKLGLTIQSESNKKQFFKYTDDGVEMIEGQAESEAFGLHILAENPVVFFATPAVHLPDAMFDGTVGHALFQGTVLTIDFHSNHAWIS